mmetsp:Transcript_13909/g.23537  ORF Transcript_13909/g.23537 Transcript_13909/m.23537 type:complete len:211 (+) Transcript_13909:726-1358(+)
MLFMRTTKDACNASCWSRASSECFWAALKHILRSFSACRLATSASSTTCMVSFFQPYGSPVVQWFSISCIFTSPATISMHVLSTVSAARLSSRSLASWWRNFFNSPTESSTWMILSMNRLSVFCSKPVCFFSSRYGTSCTSSRGGRWLRCSRRSKLCPRCRSWKSLCCARYFFNAFILEISALVPSMESSIISFSFAVSATLDFSALSTR